MYVNHNNSNESDEYISLNFKHGFGKIANTLTPITEDPICVYYFPSGWKCGHPTFHVIIEYGDLEYSDYKFLSLNEMCKYFGVSEEDIMSKQSIIISHSVIKETPNDTDLGSFVRSKFTK